MNNFMKKKEEKYFQIGQQFVYNTDTYSQRENTNWD